MVDVKAGFLAILGQSTVFAKPAAEKTTNLRNPAETELIAAWK